MRYIDADALIEELERCSYLTWSKDINRAWWAQAVQVKNNIVRCIKQQPTADVVEVVRCRDCMHNRDNGGDCDRTIILNEYDSTEYRYAGLEYCSYGERREE